ncbi:MAG: GNAT family N-acetyltransferase [Alphaproteobacteria bacterium]|nr:GNAT family N-acetyltransferase [Alphaproteobacteria bacterium]
MCTKQAVSRMFGLMEIRDAKLEDATAICEVLRQSVTNLCIGDHKNDPAILGAWLGNKTPETLKSWIEDSSSQMLVATEGDEVLAVGAIMDAGEITLNYVLPSARMRGISKKMVMALEARAKERGAKTCTLNSTGTARRFYLAMGYAEQEPKTGMFGAIVYPMLKTL